MIINEIFTAIQGEGKHQGYPVTFVRLSHCTRNCSFCDTPYHNSFEEKTIAEVEDEIISLGNNTIVFTGGEPLIQFEEIKKLKEQLASVFLFHLETNGDLIKRGSGIFDKFTQGRITPQEIFDVFDYVCISPKELKIAKKFGMWGRNPKFDVKIVTDLNSVGVEMLPYATSLMPLSTYDKKKDSKIRQKVWNYCIDNHLHYSARLHVQVWGKSKGK